MLYSPEFPSVNRGFFNSGPFTSSGITTKCKHLLKYGNGKLHILFGASNKKSSMLDIN